jgi:hypothetical protein
MEEWAMSGELLEGLAVSDEEPVIITIRLDEWLTVTERLKAAEAVIATARPLLTDPWIIRNYRPGLCYLIAKALGLYDAMTADKPRIAP